MKSPPCQHTSQHAAPFLTTRHLMPMAWALGMVLCLHMGPSRAGDAYDHNQARQALQAGQILPLSQILVQQQKDHPGQVLEVELDRDDGRWVYELKVLQPDGQLLKLELDAQSGVTLKRKIRTRASP